MALRWVCLFGAHLADRPHLFGSRASLADFALFGGNVAHFTNDPVCRRWVDAAGEIPDDREPLRPVPNRPFPSADG